MDSRNPTPVETTAHIALGAPAEPAPRTAPAPAARPGWVDRARQKLSAPGRYLIYEDSGRQVAVPVAGEMTRIGRSLSAQIRFDDATVSRRHAVITVEGEGVRVLDDRSLNGVFVNGSRVESEILSDGDMIGIGRHSLWFLDNARVGAAQDPASAAVAE